MKKKIVPFILSILLLGSNMLPVYATSLDDLNNQKGEIQGQISEVQGQQQQVKEELSKEMQEIGILDTSIEQVEAQIRELESRIATLQSSISQKQKELEEKQKEYDKNQELMKQRLVVMYERGETSFLDILFGSKNIVDFISNYYLLEQITKSDQELLENIRNAQEEIQNAKKQLEEEKAEIDSAKTERETKNNLLKSQKAEREQKANSLTEEQKELQSDIDAKNKKLAEIEAQITEQLKKIEEERKQSGGSSGGSNGIHFDGSFIWPCNNRVVTSTVKNRWGRKHKGIDIGARWENVYATASGYAYPLENPSGYGHYIIIIHGNNYMSLYGHLNAFKVSYGQYVTQGQVIAQSGDSGSSTAPHLHFELRRSSSISGFFNVSPLNPLEYLGGGYTLAAGATTES